MGQSLFEHAGGEPAFLALSRAMNRRCLADPELNHPFSHPGDPQHDERLAAYWVEVFGGPARYTETFGGTQTTMVRMHSGNHMSGDMNDRFLACFLLALDDAGLPDDEEFRSAMAAYMSWAGGDTNAYQESVDDVPDGLVVPRWSWDGLVRGPAG